MSTSEFDAEFDQWAERARGVEQIGSPLHIPYEVALEEAIHVAAFVRRYWDAADGRPGLTSVQSRLPAQTGEEILSLVRVIREAQARHILARDPIAVRHGERARHVIAELESALEFTLDEGVLDVADTQLAKVKAFHSDDGQRTVELTEALRDYAALARLYRDRIAAADTSFDPNLIDEAEELTSIMLREDAIAAHRSSPDAEAALALRHRLFVLLLDRIHAVRRAAAHVFRHRPDIVREAASAYERRKRAAARRAKGAAPPTTT